jgi:hypothetical protein
MSHTPLSTAPAAVRFAGKRRGFTLASPVPPRADPIAAWFVAAEELGEYIGIRFGHLAPGATKPEWLFLPHTSFDGIGGLAEIFRHHGVLLDSLPQLRHPGDPSLWSVLRMLPTYLKPRRNVKLRPIQSVDEISTNLAQVGAPQAVAWHVFDEAFTAEIRRRSKRLGVTVNSLLLKNLTRAIRPFIDNPTAAVSWMIPVNIRGNQVKNINTAVPTSYVAVRVQSDETAQGIHRNIYAALARGEHWANWQMYVLGRFIGARMRRYLVSTGLGASQGCLGSFSNLGDWDPGRKIDQPDCRGAWLFCPPVLRIMKLGAGCATFQNQLSLTLQIHPDLTRDEQVAQKWIQNWVSEISRSL